MKTVGVGAYRKLRWMVVTVLCAAFLIFNPGTESKSPFTYEVSAKVKISETKLQLAVGSSKTLKISGTKKKVKWKTSNSDAAKVSSKGKVTAVSTGSCKITAKVGKKNYICTTKVVEAPAKTKYTINPNTKLPNGKVNSKGDYYLFNKYLSKFEETGHGTLTIQAGTYTFKNTVYIPSNVVIYCEPGVKFVKDNSSGSAHNMFGFASSSQLADSNSNAVYGYEGSHDIKIKGNGAKINLKDYGQGFAIGHCKNITIDGFIMEDMASSTYHFFEVNSSMNVTISNCTMMAGPDRNTIGCKECINIDSDDNGGFNARWSSKDKTCCQSVLINNCTFKNAQSGIGTHNYSADGTTQKYHDAITVTNCTFENVGLESSSTSPIRSMSWRNVIIKNNTFKNCSGKNGCPIRMDGTNNVQIVSNSFVSCDGTKSTASYNNKDYVLKKNMLYISKKYNNSYPECVTKNLYYSGTTKKIQNAYSEMYDYYINLVKDNKVDGKEMKFVQQ
ncbi:MAG: Ig-like domain-containing protein [Lachnospiraceae bacterium]|nr:Ig-like domain-containing protein [Lachnospiraceae bacterium]